MTVERGNSGLSYCSWVNIRIFSASLINSDVPLCVACSGHSSQLNLDSSNLSGQWLRVSDTHTVHTVSLRAGESLPLLVRPLPYFGTHGHPELCPLIFQPGAVAVPHQSCNDPHPIAPSSRPEPALLTLKHGLLFRPGSGWGLCCPGLTAVP